jgi:hypothetical protein
MLAYLKEQMTANVSLKNTYGEQYLALTESLGQMELLRAEANGMSTDSAEYAKIQYDNTKEYYDALVFIGAGEKDILEAKIAMLEAEQAYNDSMETTIQNIQDEYDNRMKILDLKYQAGYFDNREVIYWKAKKKLAEEYLAKVIASGGTTEQRLEAEIQLLEMKEALLNEIYDTQIGEIEHKKNMGKYDDDEIQYNQDLLKVYKKKYEAMKTEGYTKEELYDIEEKIYSLEQAITDQVKDRNGERDKELERLVKQRQELLKQYNITGQGGEAIQQSEQAIKARLISLGYSEEDIAKVMQSFTTQKGYAEGGWVDDTGMALVHKGEFVLSNEMLDQLANGNYKSMLSDVDYWSRLNEISKNSYMNSINNNSNVGDIIDSKTININSNNPNEVLARIKNLEQNFGKMVRDEIYKQGADLSLIRK